MKTIIAVIVVGVVLAAGFALAAEYSPKAGVITLTNNGDSWTNPAPDASTPVIVNAIQFVPAAASKQTILRDGSATGQVLAYFQSGSTTATQTVNARFTLPQTLYLWSDDSTTTPGPRLILYTAPR